jgi:hypothetical protein
VRGEAARLSVAVEQILISHLEKGEELFTIKVDNVFASDNMKIERCCIGKTYRCSLWHTEKALFCQKIEITITEITVYCLRIRP